MPARDDVVEYYAEGIEDGRLSRGDGLIEAARTQELLSRFLSPESSILDVGGGPGFYTDWLAQKGHRVTLIDPVPLHVEQARARAGQPPRFAAQVGDARALDFPTATFDAVLAMGPLYHLVDETDRITVLREARRVCRSGGYIIATAISHFAPALGGVRDGWITDDALFAVVEQQHVTGRGYIGSRTGVTSAAYFHTPEQLRAEAEAAGLEEIVIVGIEGPGWLMSDLEAKWGDPAMRDRLMWLARAVESDPRMLSASAHLLLVARSGSTLAPRSPAAGAPEHAE